MLRCVTPKWSFLLTALLLPFGAPNVVLSGDFLATETRYATGSGSKKGVVIADFNNDGDLDVATAKDSEDSVSVLLGNGDGTFEDDIETDLIGRLEDLTAGHFNADAFLDLAIADAEGDRVLILMGDGAGGFSSGRELLVGTFPNRITAGDFNADGMVDLVVANKSSGNISVLLGQGAGAFAVQQPYSISGTSPQSLDVNDIDEDGRVDIIVGTLNSGTFSILYGEGDGTFESEVRILGSGSDVVRTGDFDNDGHVDVAAGFRGRMILRFGNGDRTFVAESELTTSSQPEWIAIADIDRNGFEDIIATDWVDRGLAIHLSNGDRTFADMIFLPTTGQSPGAVETGFLNGDGVSDIVVANRSSRDISVFLISLVPVDLSLSGFFPSIIRRGDTSVTATLNGAGFVQYQESDLRSFLGKGVALSGTTPEGSAQPIIKSDVELEITIDNVYADTPLGFRDVVLRFGEAPNERIFLRDAFEVVDSIDPLKTFSGMILENGQPKSGVILDLRRDGAIYRTAQSDTNGRFSVNLPSPAPSGSFEIIPRANAQRFFDPPAAQANYTTSFYAFDFEMTTMGGSEEFVVALTSDHGEAFESGDGVLLSIAASGLSDPSARLLSTTLIAEQPLTGSRLSIPVRRTGDVLRQEARFSLGVGNWILRVSSEAVSNDNVYRASEVMSVTVTPRSGLPEIVRRHPESSGDLILSLNGVHVQGTARKRILIQDNDEFAAELILPPGVSAPPSTIQLMLKEAEYFGNAGTNTDLHFTLRRVNGNGPNGGALYAADAAIPASAMGRLYLAGWGWQTSEADVSGAFAATFEPYRRLKAIWSRDYDGADYSPGGSQTLSFFLRNSGGGAVGDFEGDVVLGFQMRIPLRDLRVIDASRGLYEGIVTFPTSDVVGAAGPKTLELVSFSANGDIEGGTEINFNWRPEIATGLAEVERFLASVDVQIEEAFFQLGRIVSENDRSVQSGMRGEFPLYDEALSPALTWGGRVSSADAFLDRLGYGNKLRAVRGRVQRALSEVQERTDGRAQAKWGVGKILDVVDILTSLTSMIVESIPEVPLDRGDRLRAYLDEAIVPAVLEQMRVEIELIRSAARTDFPNLSEVDQAEVLAIMDRYSTRVNQLAAGVSMRGTALQEEVNWAAAEILKTRAYVSTARSALLVAQVATVSWGPASLLQIGAKQAAAELAGIAGNRMAAAIDAKAAVLWEFHFINSQFLSEEAQRLVTDLTLLLHDFRGMVEGSVRAPTYHDGVAVRILPMDVDMEPLFFREAPIKHLYSQVELTNTTDTPLSILFEYSRATGLDTAHPADLFRRIAGLTDRPYGVLVQGAAEAAMGAPTANAVVVDPGSPQIFFIPHVNRSSVLEGLPDQVRNFRLQRDLNGGRELTASIKLAVAPASGARPYLDLETTEGEALFTSSWSESQPTNFSAYRANLLESEDDMILSELMVTREIRVTPEGITVVQRIINEGVQEVVVDWKQPYPPGFLLGGSIPGALFAEADARGSFVLQPNEVYWLNLDLDGHFTNAGISFPSIEIRGDRGEFHGFFMEDLHLQAVEALPVFVQIGAASEIDLGDSIAATVTLRTVGQVDGFFDVVLEFEQSPGNWNEVDRVVAVAPPEFGAETYSLSHEPLSPEQQFLQYRVRLVFGGAEVHRDEVTVLVTADSDNDGMDDFWESDNGLTVGVDDSGLDLDGDGLSNGDEYERTTSPQLRDSDRDGLEDGPEVHVHSTNPLRWDSDFGGVSDGYEISQSLDPDDPTDDPALIEIVSPTTVIDGQDRLFLSWSASKLDSVTHYQVRMVRLAPDPEIWNEISVVTGAGFLQLETEPLEVGARYQVEVQAFVGDQELAVSSVQIEAQPMPMLQLLDVEAGVASLSAQGSDGYFDLLFSSDIDDWTKVKTMRIHGGSGTSLFETPVGEHGFFRLEHPY